MSDQTKPDIIQKQLLTVKETAKLMNISVHTIYNMRSQMKFPIKGVKVGRSVRYPRADIESWIASQSSDKTSPKGTPSKKQTSQIDDEKQALEFDDIENFCRNKNEITIFKAAQDHWSTSVKHRSIAIKLIFHLKQSGRWKKVPGYEKSSFKTFLKRVFRLSETAFSKESVALSRYADFSKKHDSGTTIEIMEKCGHKNAPIAMTKITELEEKKGRVASVAEINNIIAKHLKPAKKSRKTRKSKVAKDAKNAGRSKNDQKKIDSLKDEIFAVNKTRVEDQEQIGKLKVTVEKFRTESERLKYVDAQNKQLKAENKELRAENERLKAGKTQDQIPYDAFMPANFQDGYFQTNDEPVV